MDKELTVRATAAPWNAGIEFLIRSGRSTAEPIIMKVRDENVCPKSSFSLEYGKAQLLMDDLWVAGLRPTEGAGSAGALAATQKHLQDMRNLVFKKET
jgi:hypothetical protein